MIVRFNHIIKVNNEHIGQNDLQIKLQDYFNCNVS